MAGTIVPSPGFPDFTLDKPRFDPASFFGRLRQIVVQFDPLKLFVGDQELTDKLELIKRFQTQTLPPGTTAAQLWEAREARDCLTHPDTGERILKPFCFAAYTPFQPPIVLGLLLPGGGILNQAFWQWVNQSYHCGVLYANKNKSTTMTNTEVLKAYGGAVSVSVGLSVGMQKFGSFMQAKSPGMIGRVVSGGAPFVGVVGAGCVSLILMRYNEIENGVHVRDADGTEYPKSKVAAREGIGKCCAARVLWNIPILVGAPLVINSYLKSAMHLRNPRLSIPMQALISTGAIILGIYPAQAVFTQEASIAASKLEPEFQKQPLADGSGFVDTFFYNKGL